MTTHPFIIHPPLQEVPLYEGGATTMFMATLLSLSLY